MTTKKQEPGHLDVQQKVLMEKHLLFQKSASTTYFVDPFFWNPRIWDVLDIMDNISWSLQSKNTMVRGVEFWNNTP